MELAIELIVFDERRQVCQSHSLFIVAGRTLFKSIFWRGKSWSSNIVGDDIDDIRCAICVNNTFFNLNWEIIFYFKSSESSLSIICRHLDL